MWREQLTPLMGQEEVDRLDGRLKELNITGLNSLRVKYTDMFSLPDRMEDQQFWRMLTCIGSWPLVCQSIYDIIEYRPSFDPQDACEYILVSLLLLFCPDLLDLKERRKVEEIQTKFAVLLQNYLNQK